MYFSGNAVLSVDDFRKKNYLLKNTSRNICHVAKFLVNWRSFNFFHFCYFRI